MFAASLLGAVGPLVGGLAGSKTGASAPGGPISGGNVDLARTGNVFQVGGKGNVATPANSRGDNSPASSAGFEKYLPWIIVGVIALGVAAIIARK